MLKAVMPKTAKQTEVEMLIEEVRAVESATPPQARRLLELVAELRADVDKLGARWSPLGSAAAVGELRTRLDALARSAGEIGELVGDCEGLEGEIEELRGRAHQLDDLEVSRFVGQRCADWSSRLAEVAGAAEPGWDLGAEQDFLDDLEEELRRTFQAIYWLKQLEEALDLFDRVPDSAADGRDDLREKLFSSGAEDGWLLSARDQVDRVKEDARREKARPREIRTVGELIPLLHRWSTELKLLRDEVRQLDGRHKKIIVEDWTTALPRELLSEAQRLIGALTARAREIRDEDRRSLRSHMLELSQICGEQPVLDEGLAQLDGREVTRPEEHRHWLQGCARLRERMGAIANTHRAELDQRLSSRLEELRVALQILTAEPLSDEALSVARQVEASAARLAVTDKTDQALRAMAEARVLLEDVAGLRRQAQVEADARRAARAEVRMAAEQLDARRRKVLGDLRRLEVESLGPGERDASERLIEELDTAHGDLGLLVEKAELFQSRMEEEQRVVIERRDAQLQRLEVFLQDNLRELCPWLSDRVTALVYGLSDPLTATPDIRRQLDVISDLLDKLEFEARRRAAHRLDADVRVLREKDRDSALLEELERHGRRTLPPAVLRLKIKRAVS